MASDIDCECEKEYQYELSGSMWCSKCDRCLDEDETEPGEYEGQGFDDSMELKYPQKDYDAGYDHFDQGW